MEELVDIIIIGGGPAGLCAAIYARRANKSVLVFEADSIGGQITKALFVENYPGIISISGIDLAMNMYNQAEELGTVIEFEEVIDVDLSNPIKIIKTNQKQYKAKAVIIATGAINRKLGLSREDELTGKGISYCALCDGTFYKGETVGVVGGGSSAVDEALYLSSICKKVYLIHRRNEFRAEDILVNELKERDNVIFILDSQVISLVGDDKLSGVMVENKAKEKEVIVMDALFISIGRIPKNELFKGIIALDQDGYVNASEDNLKVYEGVFVAGDCRKKDVRQLTTAISDGTKAALFACAYLKK